MFSSWMQHPATSVTSLSKNSSQLIVAWNRKEVVHDSYRGIVINARDKCKWGHHVLRWNVNVLPAPTVLVTSTLLPCASTMCFTIARPSPVPPTSRERPLSTL